MKKFRSILVAIIIASLVIVSAGCGKKAATNADKNVVTNPDLTIYSWDDMWNTYPEWKDAKDWFEKKYGGKVTNRFDSYGNFPIVVQAAVSAGKSPDLIEFYDGWFPQFAVSNIIAPCDAYLTPNNSLYNMKLMDKYKWNGKYTIITTKSMSTMNLVVYNQTLFEENGQKTPRQYFDENNWTWENMAKVGMALTQDTNKDGIIDQWGFSTWYTVDLALQCNTGAGVINIIDNKPVDMFNTSVTIQALQLGQDALLRDKWINPTADFYTSFPAGKLAMTEGWDDFDKFYLVNFDNKFKVDVAPMPVALQGSRNTYTGAIFGACLVNGAKNPVGAIAFFDKVCEYKEAYDSGKKVSKDSSTRAFSPELRATIRKWRNSFTQLTQIGFGLSSVQSVYSTAIGEMCGGTPPATAVAKYDAQLMDAVNKALNEKPPVIEPFVALAPEDFETGTLGYMTTDGCSPEATVAVTTDAAEKINGTTSLKIVAPANKDTVDVRTDETKLKIPSFHLYHVTFNYKIIKGTAADGQFTVSIRPKANLLDGAVAFGSIALTGKDGESGQFAGDILVDSQQTNSVLVISNTKGGTIVIDDISITEK